MRPISPCPVAGRSEHRGPGVSSQLDAQRKPVISSQSCRRYKHARLSLQQSLFQTEFSKPQPSNSICRGFLSYRDPRGPTSPLCETRTPAAAWAPRRCGPCPWDNGMDHAFYVCCESSHHAWHRDPCQDSVTITWRRTFCQTHWSTAVTWTWKTETRLDIWKLGMCYITYILCYIQLDSCQWLSVAIRVMITTTWTWKRGV